MTMVVFGDWGTSRLRLWRIDDGVMSGHREGAGIGALVQSPADTLAHALAAWLPAAKPDRIVLCGMAGARNGLAEAAYGTCPADLAAWRSTALETTFGGVPLRIAAGVAGRHEDGTPDVMRGEETQAFGAMSLRPELGSGQHWVVLPGTHAKWLALVDGRIVKLRTFITGELFATLTRSSLLAAGADSIAADEAPGFAYGLALARVGSGVLGSLFTTRAAQLQDQRSASWARGFLSGLLIGGELHEMAGVLGALNSITLIGEPWLTDRYAQALAAYGVVPVSVDGTQCAIAGLRMLDADA